MNTGKRSSIIKFCLIFFLLSSVLSGNINCQESPSNEDSLAVAPLAFAISEIPSEFNKLSNRLIEISEVIQPDEKIINNDITVKEYSMMLEDRKKEIMTTLPSMTYQRLENLIRAWHNYKNRFDIIQGTLKKRISEIESVKNELAEEFQRWEKMSEVLEQGDLPGELKQTVDTALALLNITIANTNQRADALLLVRSKQTQLNLLIDEMIRIMEEEQKVFQSNYFIIDSNPIWSSLGSKTQFENASSYFKRESIESFNILITYLRSNRIIVLIQLVFVIFLITSANKMGTTIVEASYG